MNNVAVMVILHQTIANDKRISHIQLAGGGTHLFLSQTFKVATEFHIFCLLKTDIETEIIMVLCHENYLNHT